MTSLVNKVLKSSSLLIASKMLQRLIGLVSIMILARLLTPDDFAIVALTAIIIYLFDMLSNVGTEQYIIQKNHVTDQDLHTAWTIDLISKCILWLILILSAGLISDYFEQAELKSAIYAMSLLLPFNALKNPGIFLLKSDLNYKKLFWLTLVQKLISFTVVITIAYLSPSFWALIIADLAASLIFLMGSYKIHKFRPKFSLVNGSEQWLFSRWLLLKGIIGYIRSHVDTMIVSKFFSSAILGQYYLVRNIAMLPAHNILSPAVEPFLAAYRINKNNKEQLALKIRVSLLFVLSVATPIAFFIFYFPEPIIDALLGSQWNGSYKLLSSMAPLFFYFPILLVLEQVMLIQKKIILSLIFDILMLILFIITLSFLLVESVSELAIIRGGSGIITCVLLMSYIHFYRYSNLLKLAILFFPIILASLISSYVTNLIDQSWFNYAFFNLVIVGILFTLCYLSVVLFLFKLFLHRMPEVKIILSKFRLH